MKSSIPLVLLLFSQVYCKIVAESNMPRPDDVPGPKGPTKAIVKRAPRSHVDDTKNSLSFDETNGDDELLQFAETHIFRPVLQSRIRKSSQTNFTHN